MKEQKIFFGGTALIWKRTAHGPSNILLRYRDKSVLRFFYKAVIYNEKQKCQAMIRLFQKIRSILPSQELQNGRMKFFEFASGITGGKSPMGSRRNGISV